MKMEQKRTSKYKQVVQYIRDLIESDVLCPGDQLPTEAELMEQFHVSSITVRKAMEVLTQEGLIYRVKGKGTYVTDPNAPAEDGAQTRKIHLVFDLDETLDASLTKIVQGIHGYYSKKSGSYLVALENNSFIDEFLRSGKDKEQDTGLVIYMGSGDDARKMRNLRRLTQTGVKFVCIDRHLGNYPVNYVGCNNHDAVYSAVEHLVSRHHSRIGFVFQRPELSSEQERYAGYVDAMRDCGLAAEILPGRTVEELVDGADVLRRDGCTAVICANDYTASVLVGSLKIAGLEVPRDISVVGFDDSETYRFHQPALTTLRQDFYSIGYESARVLDKLMRGTSSGYTKIYIPTELVVRDSTDWNHDR